MSVIVITGGSRGIGAAAAEHVAQRGMGVILTYNASRSRAASVVERIEYAGGKAVALKLDVADVDSFEAFREAVRETLQEHWDATTLGGLVNNAGHGLFSPLASVSEAQFDGLFNVHLKGPFFLTQALLPLFGKHASIVNITSATTRVATTGVAP
jgi:NAD(P)-dependent dehydrogenase (short-subunit alcohol dehydrogenase family)